MLTKLVLLWQAHKEREAKIGEKLRGLSLSREALVIMTKKMQGTVGQLSRDSDILQSVVALCMGVLVGSIDRLHQFTLEKTLLCRQISFLQQFQAGVASQLASLGGAVGTARPCHRFRCAVIAVMAAHRFMRLPHPGCVVCQIPSGSGIALSSLKITLPRTESNVSACFPPSPVLRSSVMEGLQPLVRVLAHSPSTPLPSNHWNYLTQSMAQSLALEVAIFGRESTSQGTSLCAALSRGLERLCKGNRQACNIGSSQQVRLLIKDCYCSVLDAIFIGHTTK